MRPIFSTSRFDPNDLIPRVRNALIAKAYEERLANHAEKLEQEVRKRTAELVASREEVIHCLARAAEYRDNITGQHVVRVGRYAGIIARELGFSTADVEMLELAAQLHDVGKIGIPDAILNCYGKLDPDQFAVMQRHCSFAKNILTPLGEREWRIMRTHAQLGSSLLEISSSPILMMAARIAETHHEWWNGKGYPLGLAGEDIPLEGRITAVGRRVRRPQHAPHLQGGHSTREVLRHALRGPGHALRSAGPGRVFRPRQGSGPGPDGIHGSLMILGAVGQFRRASIVTLPTAGSGSRCRVREANRPGNGGLRTESNPRGRLSQFGTGSRNAPVRGDPCSTHPRASNDSSWQGFDQRPLCRRWSKLLSRINSEFFATCPPPSVDIRHWKGQAMPTQHPLYKALTTTDRPLGRVNCPRADHLLCPRTYS